MKENRSSGIVHGVSKGAQAYGPPILFLISIIFLAFVGGSIITIAEISPSGYIRDAYRGGTALLDKHRRQGNQYSTDLWTTTETSQRGVTIFNPAKAFDGLTLYTSGHEAKALLIDMDGRIVHEWQKKFSSLWDNTAAARDPVPDTQIFFNKARVLPNGDLLAIYIGVGDSPYGYGMIRIDSKSRLIWKNLDHFHHDFDLDDDGRIFGLTHSYRSAPLKGIDHFDPPVLDDCLVIVSPDGLTEKRISLLEAVNNSEYRRLLWVVPFYSTSDPLHTNAVDIIDHQTALQLSKKIPVAAEGQVLLSFRELAGGTVALLDVERESIVWAIRGQWLSQHDPDILRDGNLLIFDNRGHYGPGGDSRIIKVDPGTGGVIWKFTGTENKILESRIRSDQEQLPNGNILISDSSTGRLLEVTPSGEIVWEFFNPVRGGENDNKIPVVCWAQRIEIQYLHPEFRAQLKQDKTVARETSSP